MFWRKLQNFAIFTGKLLEYIIKLQAGRSTMLSQSDFNTGVFCEFCEIFKNSVLIEHLWWLSLKFFIVIYMIWHWVKSVRIRSYSCPHFSRIFPHSSWIRRDTSPNARKCGQNLDQNNSEYGHFLRSVRVVSDYPRLGKCTKEEFEGMNTFGIENYLNRIMREHPKFRQRTSDQVWLPMAKEFDQVISKIRYR